MQRLAGGCAILTTASLIGRGMLPMHPLELLEQTLCTAADMRLLRRMWYFVMDVEDPLLRLDS
jgi:hypothetical protein